MLSDVFGALLKLKRQLRKFSTKPIAINLLTQIESRENTIIKCPAMFACLYLDPRYQCALDEQEVQIAKKHLMQLYEKIQSLNQANSQPSSDVNGNVPENSGESANVTIDLDNSEDILDDLLGKTQ